MAIVHLDSFDLYSNGDELIAAYGTQSMIASYFSTTSGRFGGGGFTLSFATRGIYRLGNASATNPFRMVGMAVKFTNGANPLFYSSLDGPSTATTSLNVGIQRNVDGSIAILKDSAITVATSAPGILADNIDYYIEFKYELSATGSAEVFVNGVSVLTATGDFVEGIQPEAAFFGILDGSGDVRFDDIYYAESATDTLTPFGDVRIGVLYPNADTATEDWTPSTGVDSYAMIDDTLGGDGDTTYLSATTLNNKTTVDLSSLAESPAAIHATRLVTRASKTDAGVIEFTPYIVSGATTANGSARNPSETGYVLFDDIFETDPNTAAAWTEAALNALQAGVEITG